MSVNNFIPQLWSLRTLSALHKVLVFVNKCNRNWEGEISGKGDTLRINGVGPVTIGNYVKNTTAIVPETLTDEQQVLRITEAKYFCFEVDDVDKAQAGGTILSDGMGQAAYGFADVADQFVASFWEEAGSLSADTAINSVNVIAAIQSMGQALDEYNVPRIGRWAVLPPWLISKLVLAKVIAENSLNTALDNGFVQRALGFDISMSNNLALATTYHQAMFGTNEAMTFADQINKVEAFRPESSFSDAVKGLHVYGAKVVQPKCLAVFSCMALAEP